MSLKAEVVLKWADGEYLFALKAAQIEELQRLCDAGYGVIYQRVLLGNFHIQDLRHTIRLALIGGGMGAVDAKNKVDLYASGSVPLVRGADSPLSVAKAILNASMIGFDELEGKKPEGEAGAGANPAGGISPSTVQPSSETGLTQEPLAT